MKLGARRKTGESRAPVRLGLLCPLADLAARSGHGGFDLDAHGGVGQRATTHPYGYSAYRQVADHQGTRCHGLRIARLRRRLRKRRGKQQRR
jgi:hypothetical protein